MTGDVFADLKKENARSSVTGMRGFQRGEYKWRPVTCVKTDRNG